MRAGQAARLAKAELTAVRTLEELRRVAFFDIGELFDAKDCLKRVRKLPPAVRAALASVKVRRTNMVSGDGKGGWLHEVKLWDKVEALKVLAKHFRLVDDHVDVSGSAETLAKFAALDEGRARNAAAARTRQQKESCAGSGSSP